jgi:hypothetical protein
MTTNDFEIFFFTMTAGFAGLGVFVLVSQALLNFLKQSRLQAEPKRRDTAVSRRRGANNVPTITCALPIFTQKRDQQRLW